MNGSRPVDHPKLNGERPDTGLIHTSQLLTRPPREGDSVRDQPRGQPRVALINMPFASVTRPSLALGLFQAQLEESGAHPRTFNFNLDFARMVGFSAYEIVSQFKGVETQASEWLFAEAAWGRPFGPDEDEFLRMCGEELDTIATVPDPVAWLRTIRRRVVGPFLDHCTDVVLGYQPHVVLFSCMFFQTLSALALGRLMNERLPDLALAYGGSCFHGEMGVELLERAPWIDAISTGEADDVIVPLCRMLADGRPPTRLQSIVYRDRSNPDISDAIVHGPAHVPATAALLDRQPDPNFDDFFADAARVGLARMPSWQERVILPFETSRGCWWGQKKHCTFCGLNADGMAFRHKDADRALASMRRLSERYDFRHLQMTDNILVMSAWRDLLPRLAEAPLRSADRPVKLYYEVKANLNRAQVKALADAGVAYVQPGIETLDSHLSELMGKGVTALQNVSLLKCCREYGVVVYWNLLIRIPGERRASYQRMAEWIPRLFHLRPPSGGAPKIEVHRFSPYFSQRGRWLNDIRPARWYKGLFPAEQVDLNRVAYYFDATWKDVLGDPAYDEVIELTHEWMRLWSERLRAPGLFMCEMAEGGLEIRDTRTTKQPTVTRLDRAHACVYRAIGDIASERQIVARLRESTPIGESEILAALREFVESGLALTENGRFLGLALPELDCETPRSQRRRETRRVANQRPRRAASPG